MSKRIFNPTTRTYGNPNKVSSVNNNTYEIVTNREKFIRSFAPQTLEAKQIKRWSAPTSMAFVTAQQTVVTIGKDAQDQKTENVSAPATISPEVTVTNVTHNTIALSLAKPPVGELNGYLVETYMNTTLHSSVTIALDGSATSVVIPNLTPLTTYNLKVYSTNVGGTKSATPTIVAECKTLPSPPQISVFDITPTSFKINYLALPTDVVCDVVIVDVSNLTNYVANTAITELQIGTKYTVSVTARVDNNVSAYSGLVSLPTQTHVWTLLNAPTLNSVSTTTSAITLNYSPASSTPDAGTFENTILQTKNGGSIVSSVSTASQSTISVSGLTADTQYDMSLVSIYTHTKTDSLLQSAYTHPIAPVVSVNVLNNNSAQLTFTQLLNHLYDVSAIPVSGSALSLHNIGSPYILNSLTPSMSYNVIATTKFLSSGLTSSQYSTTFITRAVAPTINSITVNSDVSGVISYSVDAATASSGALSNVRITLIPRTTGSTLVFNTINTTAYTMTGLTPNTVYDVSMISVYANNQSDVTTSTLTTQPAVPTGLTISNLSYTSAVVYFTQISGLSYDISAIPNVLGGGANFMSQTDISSGFAITGLSEGTSYNIYLFARNAATRSKPAVLSSIITLLSAPTGLSVSHVSYTSMWLHYTPVSGLAYDATVSSHAGVVVTRTNISSGEIFDNLSEGITYTFSLTARKDRSSSPSTISETTLLHPPTDLSINDVGFNEFTVNFTQLQSIDHYDISAIPASSDAALIQFEGVNNGNVIYGLTQGMSYTVYLHAHTHDTKSAPITRNIVTLLESPMGVSVTDISYDAVTVFFDQNTDYTYTVHLYSVVNSLTYLDVMSGDRLTNLSQGTTYTLSITTNSNDQISAATEIEFTTVLNSSDGMIVVPEYTTCLLTFEQVPGLNYDVSAIPLNAYNNTIELVDISSGIILTGLSEGSYYTLYLTTYTDDIRNPPNSIDFNTYLASPTNVVISDISFTVATLTFTQNPDYVYNVDAQTNEIGSLTYSGFVSGDTLEGLPQGLYIDLYIYATSPDGIVGYSANDVFRTLIEPPKDLLVSDIGTDNFTMYFNPPVIDPNTGEIPYNIYYDSSAVHQVKNTVLSRNGVYNGYVVNGLEEGAPYRLFVNAYTDDNAVSTPATFDFVTDISIPTGLTSTDISFKSFRVWFTTLFGLTYDISAVPTSGAIVSASNVSPGYLFNNTLEEGMTYMVEVYAKTAYNRSPAATMSVTTTLSPPQDVSINDISFTSFSVHFTQNVALNYDVAVFDLSNVKLVEKAGVSSGITISSADSASIMEGHQYNVKVYARSSYQISIPTTISVTTLLSAPTGLTVSNVSYNQFDVYFNQLPGLVYDISAVTEAGAVVQSTDVTPGHTVYVATQGVLYNIYLVARTSYKHSLPSTTTVITHLEAPANFTVDTISYTSAKIHFDASLGLVYDLSAIHSDGTITWIEEVTPGQTITGLSEGIAYTFDLFAERHSYIYSDLARATFTTLLHAPTGLSISNITSSAFTLSFTEVAGLTYDAVVSDGGSDIHTLNGIVSGTVVSGLLEGTQYSISLVAKTAAQTSTATTTTAITLLSPPTNVTVSDVSYTSVVVNATSVSGLVYDVSLIAQTNGNITQVTGYTLGSPITVPYDGVAYDVYIYARSAHISSSPSQLTVTTLLYEPTGLVISQIQNTSVHLAYTSVSGLTYRVVFHPSAGTDTIVDPATTNTTVSGLISATAYTVSLYAQSAYMTSEPTTTTFVTYTNAPAGTSITSTEDTMVVSYFPFSADTDTGAFVQTDLRAVPRVSGTTTTAVGDLTTATLTGLTRGIIYDLSLVATYANTKSMPLLDNSFTIVNAPTGLSVSNILNTSCVFSFNADADLIYDISAIPLVSGATVQTSSFVSGSTVVGLTAGTSYMVYVRGYTSSGIYSPFTSSSFITKLDAITGITTSSTETTMTLNYTTPSATSDSDVFIQTDVAAKSRTDASVTYASGTTTSAQLSGLVVGTVYDISLVAVYTNTTSLTSTIVANTGVGTPTNVSVTVTGATTASVAYDVIPGYMYDISAVPVGGVGAIVTVTDHVYGTGLTGLTQATKYRIYVYAKSGGFRSSPASSDIVTYYSAGPTNDGVVAAETQLTFTYSYPATNTDSGDFQKLVFYIKSQYDGTSIFLESSTSPAICGDLVKGTIYDISMIALYQYTQSGITTFTTNTIVDTPTGLAVSLTDTTATVSFNPVLDVYYDISGKATSTGNTVVSVGSSLGSGSGSTLTGLSPARSYGIYVYARSVGGIRSDAASITNIITNVGSVTFGTLTSGTISATVAPINVPYTVPVYTGLATTFTNIAVVATVRNSLNAGVETKSATATTYSSGTVALTNTTYQGTIYDISAIAYYNTSAYKSNMATTSFTTPISTPVAPTIAAAGIYDTSFSFAVTGFTQTGAYTNIIGYDILFIANATNTQTTTTGQSVSSIQLYEGLTADTSYNVAIKAYTTDGVYSAYSTAATVWTKLAPITITSYSAYANSLTINYTLPATTNSGIAFGSVAGTAYIPGATTATATATGTINTIKFTGLSPATTYDLSLVAIYGTQTSVLRERYTGYTTNYLASRLYNKTATIGTVDAAGNSFTNTSSYVAMTNDAVRGYSYNFSNVNALLKFSTSQVRSTNTVSFWIKYNAANFKKTAVITSSYFPIYFEASGVLYTKVYTTSGPLLIDTGIPNHNEWTHYAVTVTSNATDGSACLYRNGLMVASSVSNPSLSNSLTTNWGYVDTTTAINAGMTFGFPNSQVTNVYNTGAISIMDDVRIYTKEFSQTEIQDLYSTTYVLSAPTGLNVYNVKDTQLTVAFDKLSTTYLGAPTYTGIVSQTSDSTQVATFTDTNTIITGLTAGTSYTISLTVTVNGTTSSAATVSQTTATVPDAPTNLSVTATSSSGVTVGFTAPTAVSYYDISAVTGSTVVTQRFPSYSYTGDPSFNTAATTPVTGIPANNVGLAITGKGSVRVMYITCATTSTPSGYGLLCSRFSSGAWSTVFYPTVTFDYTPNNGNCCGCAVSADGSRLVVSFGTYGVGGDNYLYYANASGILTGNNMTLNFNRIRSTAGGYMSVAMSGDGNRIVFQQFVDGTSSGGVYYSDWNSSNYNSTFTKTLGTQNSASGNTGVAISNDKNVIAYIVDKTAYYAYWNGTNYSAGTAITGTLGSVSGGRNLSFLGDDVSVLVASSYDTGCFYSIPTNGVYGTFKTIGTTALPNVNGWGMAADSSNVYLCGYGQTTVKSAAIAYIGLAARTSYIMYGLTQGSAYTFMMTASNANGITSVPSGTTSVASVAAPTFTNSVTTTTIALNYTATAANGTTGALSSVAASAKTGATTVYGTAATATGTITLSGLTTGTAYDVSMSALYAKAWSLISSVVPITPTIVPLYKYTFDSGTVSGTTVTNQGSAVGNGTLSTGVIDTTIKKYGTGSLKVFTTVQYQYGMLLPNYTFSVSSSYSVCLWIYPTVTNEIVWYTYQSNSLTTLNSATMYFCGEGVPGGNKYNYIAGNQIGPNSFSMPLNTWCHYACCYDGTSRLLYTYANGTLVIQQSGVNGSSATSLYAAIGTTWGTTVVNAYFDDYRFYNILLTSTQITSVMNNTM